MERPYLLVTLVLAVSAPLRAENILVNTRLTGAQCNPAVTVTPAGDFIVVWSSYYGSSGRSNEVMARRFDRTGAPLDAKEFQVNVTSAGNQTEPAVAFGAGCFIVVWQGPGPTGTDIFARLFDPNGIALTDEVLVNAPVFGHRAFPRVAADDSGAFVVVWQDDLDGTGATSVWGQWLEVSGNRLGDEFLIAADVWNCRYPDVAMGRTGDGVVTWLLDGTTKSVQGQLCNVMGLSAAGPFQVSEVDFSSLTRPTVAMAPEGRLVVAWDGDPNLARLDNVHARCFEPNGAPIGGQFLVNAVWSGAQQWPHMAVSDANEVVVVWQADHEDEEPATAIYARRFDMEGAPLGEQLCLAFSEFDKQRYPAVAMAADGTFVAAWESGNPEKSDYDILTAIEPAAVWPDLDGNSRIDLHDLQILGGSWRRAGAGIAADLNRDGRVDARDLQLLCSSWLR